MKRSIQIIFVIGLIYFLVTSFDFSLFWHYCNKQYLVAMLVCQLAIVLSITVAGRRFKLFLQSPNLSLKTAFNAMMLTHGFTYILPGRLSELVRVAYVNRHGNIGFIEGLSSALIERCLDVYLMCCIAVVMITLQFQTQQKLLPYLYAGLALSPVGLLLIRSLTSYWINKAFSGGPVDAMALIWSKALNERMRGKIIAQGFLLGCLSFALAASASMSFVQIASTYHFTWIELLTVFCVVTVGAAIPLLPGGIGTMEGGVVLILQHFGVTLTEAIALSLGIRLCMILVAVPWAIGITLKYGTGLTETVKESWKLSNRLFVTVFKSKKRKKLNEAMPKNMSNVT